MRIIRYIYKDEPPKYGWLLDEKVGEIEGELFGHYRRQEARIPVKEVRLVAPTVPTKIICVGRNYLEHAKELGNDVPKVPLIFMKPPSAIIAHGETVILPPQSQQVEHEAELVAVVGKRGRHIPAEEAKTFILGYTVGNDITARDLQKIDGQWTRAKGFDTFCSFGPWIDTEFDPSDAVVTCRVNGQMRQLASTRDMVFN
ncbi:MAG: 2-hydroxyhepta-2,4-diene-1,7-dioate isomerase, partial [Chloroflexi bacterium RBG_16_51_16]